GPSPAHLLAAFRFHDALRGETSDEVHALGKRGLRVSILSGDREPKVADIAAQLGLQREQWHHSLTPDEKAAWIAAHDPHGTLYIGDGANDSLAFDAASCAGSPVTGRSFLEHKADFYFLGHSMRFMSSLLDIAAQLGLQRDQWHHSLTPDEKAAWIAAHDPHGTLYIGDGANDSLAFDAASCAGSPVTGRSFLEHKADFYFLGHSMRFMSSLLDIAATHRLAVRAVFAFSVTYNIVTAIMGLMGHLSPLLAAILMPLSSLVTLSLVTLIFRAHAERKAVADEAVMIPWSEPSPSS
ncbi:MAG: HAD family hydrolase, partial [Prosthecobacter sp.]